MTPTGGTPWGRLPPELGDALRGRMDRTVHDVTSRVISSVPALAEMDDPKVERDTQLGVRFALERFLDLIGTDQPALPPSVRDAFVALGAAEAREDRGTETLLGGLRIASRLLLRAASEALGEVRPVDADVVLDLSDAVTTFVDELALASTDGYALQVREQAGEGDRRRRLLAELLLRGGATPTAVQAAAEAIGWHGLDVVVPVLLPPEQARDARFRYGADGVVLEREHDGLLLLRAGPRSTRDRLAEALRGRDAVVGPAAPWPHVPAAVRLTEVTARHVGSSSGGSSGGTDPGVVAGEPVFTDDHLAVLVLHGEPGALDVLAAHRLAPLDGLRDGPRERLLETLDSWLRHWGSRPEVAVELFVHPQTVSYRLRRLRALLGDDLDDPTARFELLLVLEGRRRTIGPSLVG